MARSRSSQRKWWDQGVSTHLQRYITAWSARHARHSIQFCSLKSMSGIYECITEGNKEHIWPETFFFFLALSHFLSSLRQSHIFCVQCNDRAAGECYKLCVMQSNWSVYQTGAKTVIERLVVKVCNLFLCPCLQPTERKQQVNMALWWDKQCVWWGALYSWQLETPRDRQTGEKAW